MAVFCFGYLLISSNKSTSLADKKPKTNYQKSTRSNGINYDIMQTLPAMTPDDSGATDPNTLKTASPQPNANLNSNAHLSLPSINFK